MSITTATARATATMTCDIPVVEPARVCRPTGRPERRAPRRAVIHSGERPRTAVRRFEQHWVAVVLVAGVLAAMAWLVLMSGAEAAEAADGAAPVTPAATSVVYVRSGESLTALAERIAPDLPADGVIAQVREMNGLQTSGLSVGQPLVVPDYR